MQGLQLGEVKAAATAHSRVPDLVRDGERCGQADVLVYAAASLWFTHASDGRQTWRRE